MAGNMPFPITALWSSALSLGGSNWKFSNNAATKACISIMLHSDGMSRWSVSAVLDYLTAAGSEGRGATYENFHPMHARTPAATGIVGIVGIVRC